MPQTVWDATSPGSRTRPPIRQDVEFVAMASGTVALGVIGNITALIMFFSPLPTFFMIYKNKDTGRFSAFPYLCTLLNCLLWFFYGLPMVSENNTLVLTINGAGIIVEFLYLMFFLYYAPWNVKTRLLRKLVLVIMASAVIFAITLGAFKGDGRTIFLGSINVIFNTVMYAAPLSVMRLVIETKSVEYMPFLLSLCSFVNATLWALYGILKEDKFIIIPNGLGVVLGAIQLALYAKYRKNEVPPATLTEEIGAAYTTESVPELSQIITESISPAPREGPEKKQDVFKAATEQPSSKQQVADRVSQTVRETVKPISESAKAELPEPLKDKEPEAPKKQDRQAAIAPLASITTAAAKTPTPPAPAPAVTPAATPPIPAAAPPPEPVAAGAALQAPSASAAKKPTLSGEDKARKDQEDFAARMKAEEEKRASELRRLQEEFDEDECTTELETIFL